VTDVELLTGSIGARDAGSVLGPAFVEDPLWAWLVRGGDRRRRLTRLFGAFAATVARTPGSRIVSTSERTAVALWLPPGTWRPSLREGIRTAPAMVDGLRGGVLRGLRVEAVVERHHPREPHWYLEALGALPSARGTGVGGRVLAPVLERCDAEGVPAYLESSNPRNWSFYARHGFVGGDPLPLPPGCPMVLPMWREPGAARG
jgi:GNAT superfamily N-acetyltransferase